MAGNRTLKLSILADVDDLRKKLGDGNQEVEGFAGKLENFGKVAGAAFLAAGAAAAAYAGKLAVDGVKAAMEDEAAQVRLASALQATTGATQAQVDAIEKQILKTELATGVSDDQLRPAIQRLAIATHDLNQSQDLLSLALDVSKGTGKDLNDVVEALAKAYEGQEGKLVKLGIGITAADAKTMDFRQETARLAELFGGSAAKQAETFQGQIDRLKVGFQEAKETVGSALLPIIQELMNYFINTLIPKFIEAKDKAIEPITKAFNDHKDTIKAVYNFVKDYLVPIFETTLVNAIGVVGKAIGGLISLVSTVIETIKSLINSAIDGINAVISAYNKLPFPDIGLISKIGSFSSSSSGASISKDSMPFGGASVGGSSQSTGGLTLGGLTGSTGSTTSTSTSSTSVAAASDSLASSNTWGGLLTDAATNLSSQLLSMGIDQQRTQYFVNLTVNGAIDPESTARQISDLLYQSQDRGGGGGDGRTFAAL